MGSTKKRPRAEATPAEDSFETLRQAFNQRLESDRVHLVTLSAALARAEENPAWIFEDLQFRAHRLQGGAAIFEESELARAAGDLEAAAVSAAARRAGNTDEKVWAALVNLVQLMGRRCARWPASDAATYAERPEAQVAPAEAQAAPAQALAP